jgi:putative nucleotidyltransferase with HDIG domain
LTEVTPGTFQHSIGVGVLADAAARATGVDPLLVRVAALYHDVGKTTRPEMFVENQREAESGGSVDAPGRGPGTAPDDVGTKWIDAGARPGDVCARRADGRSGTAQRGEPGVRVGVTRV